MRHFGPLSQNLDFGPVKNEKSRTLEGVKKKPVLLRVVVVPNDTEKVPRICTHHLTVGRVMAVGK